ncbi:molecular chaperone TorD [Aliagarivorans taiwanensis]|uniref:molecular chaperone TorD n=1 Tax=Aliagarivorans taiwanensis TaxID=561966 RepID=UPI000407E088|nr:molecular chaperone TorD [Aliagarivorans taiwanensis]
MEKNLEQQAIKQAMEGRAGLYWWFSSLLIRELTNEQLQAFCSEQGSSLLSQLATEPSLRPACEKVSQELAKLRVMQDPQLELAADYAATLLGDHRSSAPPYASLYANDSALMYQEPHQQMLEALSQWQLGITLEFNEPADHFAIVLDLMGNLAIKSLESRQALTAQLDLVTTLLLPALKPWCEACQKHTGLYAALSLLLYEFVKLDLSLLQEE